MNMRDQWFNGFLNAFGVFIYVSVIGWFISNGEAIFGPEESAFVPVFMLLLLVISAAVTGLLVFGRPALWYMNDRKKEAIDLLFVTITWLTGFLVLVGVWMLAA